MVRKKILWLVSWYPDRLQPYNGDFIQRHAQAAALFNDIYVIHVVKDREAKGVEEEIISIGGLTEHRIYFRPRNIFPQKFWIAAVWYKVFKQAINSYVRKNRGTGIVHVHVPFKAGLLALWMRKKFEMPFLVTEHWGIYNDIIKGKFEEQPAIVRRWIKRVIEKANTLLSVSNYVAEGINRLVTAKTYRVIPNAVDTSLFFFKEKAGSRPRFIHVSNMVPLKNVEGILMAIKQAKEEGLEFEFVFVGPAPNQLVEKAAGLGLQNVHFRGEIQYSLVAREMQGSDYLVLFSDIENSPCVIGEALCCGLPVIATNVGGIPELTDESNSIIIEPRNVPGLANAMKMIVAGNDNYNRREIAAAAIEKFSYDKIGRLIADAYESLALRVNP